MKDRFKFKRYHFSRNGDVLGVTEWGIFPGEFRSPSSISGQHRTEDVECTCLPDKNGMAIYEGDICRNHEGHIYVAGFHQGMFTIVGGRYANGRRIEQPSGFPWASTMSEIIGNKYQHPELLEGKP